MSEAESVKQLNIRLTEEARRELKAKCAMDGISMAGAVEELVRLYLAGKVKLGASQRKD